MTNPQEGEQTTSWRSVVRVWLVPAVVVSLLMGLLATMYLSYVVDPGKHLHSFPIALVDQDSGDVIGGKPTNVGKQISDALVQQIPGDKIDLRVLGINEAQLQLDSGDVYGAIVIPSDFTKRLGIFATASVVPGEVTQPIITVYTNPRTGSFSAQVVQTIAENALNQANLTVGKQLTDNVQTQLQSSGGGQTPELVGLSRLMLSKPIDVVVSPFHPLPSGTGGGLTAFFYTVMVLLAGFTGAMVINGMVDSSLGFAPTEFGPWYVHYPPTPISRLRTLLLKWGVITATAPVAAGIFMAVGHWLDMPIERPLLLFLYSTFAIIAVGVTALSIVSALGTLGLLVNLVLFIVLGLPSSGGTIPVEALPKSVAWLAQFEPMHQVYLGIRAILYFNADGSAGFTRAIWMTLLGMVIGLVLGSAVTRYYDWKELHRAPAQS
ncbi:YhgE/Pip domain-containing protein [Nocardia pseudovaccinii]|uniref:YhgE/Pip domain-containing protein n=1 Tax=Nocardia pseudovaccinii TaxID=189540 RepID=UPI0007A477C9|nr:ABC transporter permease [Nocardia pseudovaccinii]